MTTANFSIDRRPVAMIPNFGGQYHKTSSGQPLWLYEPGGVAKLIEDRILPLYEIGFRRIILHLPAGTPGPDRLMTSCQWGYLPDYRKEEFNTVMRNFLNKYQDIDLGVYMGFKIFANDPTNPAMPETGSEVVEVPNWDIRSHREWFAYNVGNYIDLGIRWFSGDAASEHRPEAIKLHQNLSATGIGYVGEALPTFRIDGQGWFIDDEINQMPWLCIHKFAAARDPEFRWEFDAETTEAICVMSGHGEDEGEIIDESVIRRRAAQGFVLGTMFSADDPRTQLIYDVAMEPPGDWQNPWADVVRELRYETLEELALETR